MSQAEAPNDQPSTAVVIETDRQGVLLRQFTPIDALPLFSLIAQNREHLSQHGDNTSEKYPTYESVEESITNPKNPKKLRLGVWDDGTLVGTVNLTPGDGEAEIGYWIGKQFSGKHYAAVAAKALAAYAKESLKFNRIFAKVKKSNDPSLRTISHAGFQKTGEDTEDYIYTY